MEFVFSASAICAAPSALKPLERRLQHESNKTRQGLLTVGREASGGILDTGEGGVRLQEVGDDACALHLKSVVAQTAIGSRLEASVC